MLVKFKSVVPAARSAAWSFIAHFENIAKWDPGVKSSKKARLRGGAAKSCSARHQGLTHPPQVSEGAAGVGTQYELVTVFKGSESTMKCATCAARPAHQRAP